LPPDARFGFLPTVAGDHDDGVGGVLRWLLSETDAESASFLMLGVGGVEQFRVEPRGLSSEDLNEIAARARKLLLESEPYGPIEDEQVVSRWLGIGGSKLILIRGTSPKEADDHLRFARFIIEWIAASASSESTQIETRLRSLPGVAWAEFETGDPGTVRVLMASGADPEDVLRSVEREAPSLSVVLEGPGGRMEEPRAQLVDIRTNLDGEVSAEVSIHWQGRELRGKGLGRPSPAGRAYASAEAVIDAMKPLVEADLEIEGLYRTADAREGADVVVVSLRVGRDRFAGAVISSEGTEAESGARAVLDALNRRLPRIAGRSGQI
jgi:hypothetical protein